MRREHYLCAFALAGAAAASACSSPFGEQASEAGAGPMDATVDGSASGGDGVPDSGSGDQGTSPVPDASTCPSGVQCNPSQCLTGSIHCAGGSASCVASGTVFDGTPCDAGAVCHGGACAACAAGTSCADAGSCKTATLACSTGVPTCIPGNSAPNGSPCGTGLYCNAGTCAPCSAGAPCTPATNPCHQGLAACNSGAIACTDTDASAAAGTICGTNQVCNAQGQCVSCLSAQTCNPGGNLCLSGYTDCSTGASACKQTAVASPGTPCGTNMVCNNGGTCVACTAGLACQPSPDPCVTGTTTCSTGVQTCGNSVVVPNGTACGTNMVCSGGNCVSSSSSSSGGSTSSGSGSGSSSGSTSSGGFKDVAYICTPSLCSNICLPTYTPCCTANNTCGCKSSVVACN
jgi:hypothetical protein